MKAISIRQPWAWLILHAGKDIENRPRNWNFRGKLYLHASKGMTRDEYLDAELFTCDIPHDGKPIELPPYEELQRGGIVGTVEVTGCVEDHASPWFNGPFGLVLKDATPLPFFPFKGALGIFEVTLDPGTPIVFSRDIIECPGGEDHTVWAREGDLGRIDRPGGPLGHWVIRDGNPVPFEAALATDFNLPAPEPQLL